MLQSPAGCDGIAVFVKVLFWTILILFLPDPFSYGYHEGINYS